MDRSSESATSTQDEHSTYTVVLRCGDAHFRVPAGRGILIGPIRSEFGNFELKILTRTDELDDLDTPIPRELWIEVTGPAPSLQEAVNLAAATANDYVRQVAFGANAWQGVMNVHLAFDSTAGRREREFFQNWVPDEKGLPRQARDIDPDLMYRLLAAITNVDKREQSRLNRSITQYTDALQYWKRGNELYALAHLYMGVEAITETAIRREVKRRGLANRKALEIELNGPPAESALLRIANRFSSLVGGRKADTLGPWARRDLIFCGDKDTYLTAKRASDQFEHGLSEHHQIHELASKCIRKTAMYLREQILSHIPLSNVDFAALKKKPYKKPNNTGGFERQFLATIVSDEDDIAAPDQAYPYVKWHFALKEFSIAEDGGHQMRVTQTMTPLIGENAQMRFERVHFSGSTETTHSDLEIKITKANPSVSESGVTTALDNPEDGKWLRHLGGFISNCNTIRRLSKYWIMKLSPRELDMASEFSFDGNIEQIQNLIHRSLVDRKLISRCDDAWEDARNIDEARRAFSGATTVDGRLVIFDNLPNSDEKTLGDIRKLNELVDKSTELATRLAELLDELLKLPEFPTNQNNAD